MVMAGKRKSEKEARPAGRDPSAREEKVEKSKRVAHIAELMAGGQWVTGVTARGLAIEWGIHYDTVKKDAAEASRRFKEDPEEREDRKARWLAKLESAQANARHRGRCEAEARFLELEAKARGFFEPERVELSGNLGDLLTLGLGKGGEEPPPPVEG